MSRRVCTISIIGVQSLSPLFFSSELFNLLMGKVEVCIHNIMCEETKTKKNLYLFFFLLQKISSDLGEDR